MNELIENINKINSTSVEDLTTNINQKATGTLEFPGVKSQVGNIKKTLSLFVEDKFKLLPFFRQTYFKEITSPLVNKVLEMQNVGLDKSKPIDHQQQHFNEYFNTQYINEPERAPEDQGYAKYINKIWDIIVESLVLKQEKGEPDVDELKTNLQGRLEAFSTVEGELRDASGRIQEELKNLGIGKHTRIFHAAAVNNGKNSVKWLRGGMALLGSALIVIGVLGFIYFKWIRESIEKVDRLEFGILTALILSFISYGIYVCFRNYFAEKHNQKINQHKANCLSTYFTFIDSADDETKQAILQFATQTIYSHQPTGYSGKGSDSTSNPNPIIEVFKNVPSNVVNSGG